MKGRGGVDYVRCVSFINGIVHFDVLSANYLKLLSSAWSAREKVKYRDR